MNEALLGLVQAYLTNQLPSLPGKRTGLKNLFVLQSVIVVALAYAQLWKDLQYILFITWGITTILWVIVGVIGLVYQQPKDDKNQQDANLRERLLLAENTEVAKRQADSLHHQILMDAMLEEQSHQVGRPNKLSVATDRALFSTKESAKELELKRQLVIKNQPAVNLPHTQSLIEVFLRADIGGRLLILGEPGVGKTAQLLELARSLIKVAFADPSQPIPIILELSSWQDERLAALDWMIVQLKQKYNLDPGTSREYLLAGKILPLLDGLDELGLKRQQEAIQAINDYLRDNPTLQLVVCCRSEAYAEGQQLIQLNGAVQLKLLESTQIYLYLAQLNRLDLWHHLRQDRELFNLCGSIPRRSAA